MKSSELIPSRAREGTWGRPRVDKPVVVKDGRFRPYIADGETHATLRKADSIEEIMPERAAEKRAKGPAPEKTTTRRTTTRKAPAKKPAAKK